VTPTPEEGKMTIKEEIRNDIAILRVTGSLMSGPDVQPFHQHIQRLTLDGINKAIVDFSKVKWFGSSMLGVLTASLASLRKEGGDLRLTGVTNRIESILMVTKLASIFRTLDSVDLAVRSFIEESPVGSVESTDAVPA